MCRDIEAGLGAEWAAKGIAERHQKGHSLWQSDHTRAGCSRRQDDAFMSAVPVTPIIGTTPVEKRA